MERSVGTGDSLTPQNAVSFRIPQSKALVLSQDVFGFQKNDRRIYLQP